PPPPPILTATRLQIRPMHPQDAPSMAVAAAPYNITQYMTNRFAHPYTLTHAETFIKEVLTQNLPSYDIVLPSAPDIVIGGIGLKPGSDVFAHTAELGYWISEDYWGRGLMTEAVRAFTSWVFMHRAERRLCAGVFDANEGSQMCLRRCGYIEEGRFRGHVEKRGVVMDLVWFGLLKSEWEDQQREREKEK
ncbi:acyl-CoA N-acyltransferase, partial [Sporormia fimetaria CBS 119925]